MGKYLKKFFVILFGLFLLAAGIVLATLYISFNQPDLMVWAIIAGVIIYFSILFFSIRYLQKLFSANEQRLNYLLETGHQATATVKNIESTKWRINFNPVLRVTLSVKPSLGSPFPLQIEKAFPIYKTPRLGDQVKVLYNPEKTQDILIID